ncbi:alpha-D-xyloside xylohydrolase [Lachnospiraceae bacterium]|nr:alpha-D-xyloside xylohydrolase [Lachnospiraceae bacterium]
MRFMEGYWLASEKVQPSYATQAFKVYEIENGMRILAPEKPILSRADALDITVLQIDFVSAGHNDVETVITHYKAYDPKEPRFKLNRKPDPVEVSISEDEAVMKAGDITVRVFRKNWMYQFEAEGRVLTSSGFRNLGYMRWDKKPSTVLPDKDYMRQTYEPYIMNELSLKANETVYGFGEKFTAFVKNGQTVKTWTEDGGTSSDVSYKHAPFYMTSEGYGVFVDHTGPVEFEVATAKVEYVGFSIPGEQLRFHLIYGRTPADILDVYTTLTGKPALPPAWSFGLWLSTSFKPDYSEETTSKLIAGMKERNIPVRVFHFDCYWMRALHWCDFVWDSDQFGNVREMIERYHEKGLKCCTWINPYVSQYGETFDELAEKGYFLMREDGRGVKQVDNWQPGLAVMDFTNPDAREWFAGKIKDLLDLGIDAIKTDFGERIPIDVKYFDGSDPVNMHNYYTQIYNEVVFRAIEEKRGKGEAVLFARSATAGGQQFPAHWGGDCSATYPSMAETLRAGLSFAMSGFSFWSHDISGFESTATPDLYKRWAQFGLLSSHSRLHGSDTYRVPWIFDEESNDVVRKFVNLKCSLMPYIFRMAVIAHEKGTPVMRPMPFEFPSDPGCRYLDLQYMFGESLLVAPIFNEDSRAEFYLPNGTWKNLLDDEILEGGRWYVQKYDYMHMPLFVRENTLLPVGGNTEVPDYDYLKGLTLKYYLPIEGQESVCEIPDLTGKTVMTFRASLKGDAVKVTSSAPAEAEIEFHTNDGKIIKAKLNGTEVIINF